MKILKAIWRILTADDFFVVTYHSNYSPEVQTADTIKYTIKNFNQYFCDSIKEYINFNYDKLPKFSNRLN